MRVVPTCTNSAIARNATAMYHRHLAFADFIISLNTGAKRSPNSEPARVMYTVEKAQRYKAPTNTIHVSITATHRIVLHGIHPGISMLIRPRYKTATTTSEISNDREDAMNDTNAPAKDISRTDMDIAAYRSRRHRIPAMTAMTEHAAVTKKT